MKIKLLAILLLIISNYGLYAQGTYSIKGSVGDTSAAVKLRDVAVSVLNARDSILVKFGWSGAGGEFSITNLPAGKFIMLVTYPGYADHTRQFVLDSLSKTLDFGNVALITKARLLEEVIVRARAAIVLKGDTTEFNAEGFVIQPHSKVEDLIKQFPGIEVDNNGRITAQGKTVERVLVDGEEFFGDDPTLVTRNIRGDMVDKIQLYDDKTDQAKFTGIDDGRRIKTMNVVLKEDSKKGYFGNLNAGTGTENRHQGQALFNSFRTNSKLSVYGTAANNGKVGVGFADGEKYGASSYVGPGIWQGTLDEFETFSGRYEGRGIPLSKNAGAHYDAKWNRGKSSINMNYRAGTLDVEGLSTTINENILPSMRVINTFNQVTDNSISRQRFDVNFRTQLDSTSSIQILSEASIRNTNTQSLNYDSGLRDNATYQYLNTRNLSNDAEQKGFNLRAGWNKRLKKPRRTLSISGSYAYNQENRDGYLNTENDFYDTMGSLDSIQRIDQNRRIDSKTTALSGSINWSEPVSKSISATANYTIAVNSAITDRESYNKSGLGTYVIPEPLYTNDLHFDMLSNQARVGANYQKNKNTLNVGAGMTASRYKQNDKFINTSFDRSFINWNPQAQYSYSISPQKSFSFRYDGNNTQPGVNQIQSLRINDDPLNITIGNPHLRPSFSNSFFMTYSSFRVLTNLSFSMYAGYTLISNPFTTNNAIDDAGKRTLQWVNLDKTIPVLSSNISLNKKFKSGLQLGTSLLLSRRNEYNYINSLLNNIDRDYYSFTFSASKSKLKKYSLSLSLSPNYSMNRYSLQNSLSDNRWGMYSSASFTAYLPGKTEISSNATYQFNEKTRTFGETVNPFILNSSISKRFLKSESLKLSASGSDIFKQNLGFIRGPFSQTSYNTIQRYYMLSLAWDFSKMGAAKQ